MNVVSKQAMFLVASFLFLATQPSSAQENLGTAFGIPSSSPGVMWPSGSSLETLGFGRLYPNGPEFGLGNTSGGFGVTGSGRLSGVGLAERGVSSLVQQQMERPYVGTQRLTDAFASESARGASVFSSALGDQFRTQIRVGSVNQGGDSIGLVPVQQLVQPTALPSVDAVLQDGPATTNAVLKTGL
jgi:hypothetical protein